MENFTVEVSPETFEMWGLRISQSQVTLMIVTVLLAAFALIFRYCLFPRFKERPGKFQNVIELMVEAADKMAGANLHGKCQGLYGYSFSLMAALGCSFLMELLGFRIPATDFNFTFAIAVMSLCVIVFYGIRYKGGWGYVKSFGKPLGIMWPFRVLSELLIPVSLSCRMFGNLFASMVIMDIVYSAMSYFAVGVPAVLAIYFNLFDVAIQVYIFVTLTQIFASEAVEEE
ncbi:MAG: FoF1 ATP synthase subunit A [Candidatus Fimadaptatus sp.]|jgi:F-type H+-transporting ATPase subunit a